MASDAGKLIALSLGKIADSRKQRGGINLCKNLLVSTILFKARSIYMMENYQQIAEARKQKKDVKKSAEKFRENKVDSVPERVESSDLLTRTASDPDTSRIPVNDKENISPVDTSNSVACKNNGDENMDCDSSRKDCASAKTEEKLFELKDNSQCSKCTKRRRSEVSDNNAGSTDSKSRVDESGPVSKVAKIESATPCSDKIQQTTSSPEPMVTEPPQISNLVQIFNTGFAGLCEQTNTKDSYSSQTCVKQVPSFVENLSRPVIALAV